MKKWFVYGAIFVGVYLGFVIANVPANWVVSKVKLPEQLAIENITGSIWNSSISQVSYLQKNQASYSVSKITVGLNVPSLLFFNPSVDITFGDALIRGPEGSLTVSGFTDVLIVDNLDILLAANDIAQKLSLPMPVIAHNDIKISVPKFVVGKPLCQSLDGQISWEKASASALDERVDLGALSATLTCENGALALTVDPKNDLGLTFTTYVRDNSKVSGNGFLKPADRFPEQLKGLLPFLGNKDNQGRYRLGF